MPESAEGQVTTEVNGLLESLGEKPTSDQVYDALVAIARLAEEFPEQASLIGRAGERLAARLNS